MYEDKQLTCKDCGATFIFTAGEQEFYAEKGFVNEPQRCKECRSSARQIREASVRFTQPFALLAAGKQESPSSP